MHWLHITWLRKILYKEHYSKSYPSLKRISVVIFSKLEKIQSSIYDTILKRIFWFYFRNWGKNARLTLTKLSPKFTNITKFLKQNQGIPNEILFAVKPNSLRFCHKICWTKLKRFYRVCHYKVKIINFQFETISNKIWRNLLQYRKLIVWEVTYRASRG